MSKKILKDAVTETSNVAIHPTVERLSNADPIEGEEVHRVVTTYKRTVPIVAEASGLDIPDIEEEEIIPDHIAQMLADLGADAASSSWTMIIYRLPKYDQDGRFDIHADRVNCGTRPVTINWEEDIRNEFARPGLKNAFTVTFKRDGKIFSHLRRVLKLEPPTPEIIAAQEAKFQSAMTPPVTALPNFKPPSLKDQLAIVKELAELREFLMPPPPEPPPPPPPPLTSETALLHLLTQSPDAVGQLTDKLFGRLIGGNASASADSEPSLAMIAFEAVRQGTLPAIARELAGIFRPMLQQPGPSFTAAAPPPIAPPAPDPQPAQPAQQSPEEFLLAQILDACAVNLPTHLAANGIWAIVDAPQNALYQLQLMAALRQLSEMPAEMLLPMAQSIRPEIERAPHAAQWLADVQQRIKTDLESEANGDTDGGA